MSRTKLMLRGGGEVNLCSRVRGFLQRKEKANRTKTNPHILIFKPCTSFISFKKNGGNPLHPKGEKSLPLVFQRYWNPPGGPWLPERGGRGGQRQSCLPPSSCPQRVFVYCRSPSRAESAGPGAPGRETPPPACKNWSWDHPGLHTFGPSPARPAPQLQQGLAALTERTQLRAPLGLPCSNRWGRGSSSVSVPGIEHPGAPSPEQPLHGVPLRVMNGSFAWREALGKMFWLQLRTITLAQSYELIIGSPKSPLCFLNSSAFVLLILGGCSLTLPVPFPGRYLAWSKSKEQTEISFNPLYC